MNQFRLAIRAVRDHFSKRHHHQESVDQLVDFCVGNESALPWQTWRLIDDNVTQAARAQPRLLGDFNAAGMGVTIDAMEITMVTYRKRLGQAHARIGMDPSVSADRDRSLEAIGNT